LGLVVVVFAGDVGDFEFSVFLDLLENLGAFFLNLLDFALHLVNLGVLDFDLFAMGLLLSLDLLEVVSFDFV
jgi:hypothetical protein